MSEETQSTILPVVPEVPGIVTGGPLDPTSPEGRPPEGETTQSVTPEVKPQTPSEAEVRAFLQGQQAAIQALQQKPQTPNTLAQYQAAHPIPTSPGVVPGPTAMDRAEELIFSKPKEALEIAMQEAKRQWNQEIEQKRLIEENKKVFWNEFYEKHQDLKNFEYVVQSMVKAKSDEISKIATKDECLSFISQEARKIVDSVKKQLGVTESVVPSSPAVSFGANKDLPVRPSNTPQAPINFADQLKRLRPKAMGKK